ncbi:MAG: alkaline phosphatase [Bacteroidales bacterium]|nr:alkaline phosphatase [Bacteroidales bacterium]
MKFTVPVILSAAIVALAVSCKQSDEPELQYYTTEGTYDIVNVTPPPADAEVRNVIFLIGDGMGLEQTSCAWVLNHGKLNFDNFPVVGLSRTYSADNLITDSGAGGTALAAGQKTGNNHVGSDINGEPLYSMLHKAHALGWKTGVVTTCHLADATPVDFCCHNEHRYNTDAIIADYLNCNVDYIAGGGSDLFAPAAREDGRNIAEEMAQKGYSVVNTEEELMAAPLPVLGLLAPDNLPVALERGDLFRHMVARGIEQLSAASEGKGFAMMIEGSCIDDWLHENRIDRAMEELLDFDRTIGDVLEWAAKDGHTLVVVAADHATGALTLQDGDLEEGKIGVAFGNDSHNGIAVPYYAWGPGSCAFGGILENAALGALIASFVK